MKTFYIFTCCLVALLVSTCSPDLPPVESSSDEIRLNQLGYYPTAHKKAVVVNEEATDFHLVNTSEMKVVYENFLSDPKEWNLAGERVRVADFSEYRVPGE